MHIIARHRLEQFVLFLEFAKAHANVMIGIAKSLTIQTEELTINGAHATALELISEFGSWELAEEVIRSCEAVYPVSYEQCGKMISKIPQRKLIEKIILFIELDSGKKLPDEKKESYRNGVCLGLSIVESYMEVALKTPWWDELTTQMIQWDGNKESLRSSILLPMTDGAETLYSLFRRAVYYILYNQQEQLEFGNNAEQFRFLREKRFFSEKGNIQTYEVAAGYFDDTDLNGLLHPNVFSQEAIYLITGNFHCCTLRYKDGAWHFRDPSRSAIFVYFDKQFLISRITQTLGNSLSIEIASWKNSSELDIGGFIQKRDALMERNPAAMLREAGFRSMLVYSPDELTTIIKASKKNTVLTKNIGDALSFQRDDELCGLLLLAEFGHEQLSEIIFLARTDRHLIESIARAMQVYDHSSNQSGITSLATLSPKQFSEILDLAKTNAILRVSIAEKIKLQNSLGETLLHILIWEKNSILLDRFMALVQIDADFRNAFSEALSIQTLKGGCVLLFFAKYMPSEISNILILAKTDTYLRNNITKAMLLENENGFNSLHAMAKFAPHLFPDIFKIARTDESLMTALTNSISKQDVEGSTVIHILASHPGQLSYLFNLAKVYRSLGEAITKTLTLVNSPDNISGLFMIARYANAVFGDFIKLAECDRDMQRAILSALPIKDNGGHYLELHISIHLANHSKNFQKMLKSVRLEEAALNKFYEYKNDLSVKFQTLSEIIECVKGEYATGVFGHDIKLKYKQHLERFDISLGDLAALSPTEAVDFVSEKIISYSQADSSKKLRNRGLLTCDFTTLGAY